MFILRENYTHHNNRRRKGLCGLEDRHFLTSSAHNLLEVHVYAGPPRGGPKRLTGVTVILSPPKDTARGVRLPPTRGTARFGGMEPGLGSVTTQRCAVQQCSVTLTNPRQPNTRDEGILWDPRFFRAPIAHRIVPPIQTASLRFLRSTGREPSHRSPLPCRSQRAK